MKKHIRPGNRPWANATGDGRWNKTHCSCGAEKHIHAEAGTWSKTWCSCGAEKLIYPGARPEPAGAGLEESGDR